MMQMRKRFLDICAEELDNVAGAELIEQTEAEVKYLEEEAIKQEMNIAQDIAAIEELTEDINIIQDQLGENDKKLTDPDIVVTAVDVEVSEECYKALAFKHGIRNINAIRFSSESVLDSVKAEPRRYLSMSSEGLKDIFIKIWEKIKAFFRAIGEKLGIVTKVKEAKMKKTVEKAKKTVKEIKELPEKAKKIDVVKELKSNKNDSNSKITKLKDRLRSNINVWPLTSLVLIDYENTGRETVDVKKTIMAMEKILREVHLMETIIKSISDGAFTKEDGMKQINEIQLRIQNIEMPYERFGKYIVKYKNYIESEHDKDEIVKLLNDGYMSIVSYNTGGVLSVDKKSMMLKELYFTINDNFKAYDEMNSGTLSLSRLLKISDDIAKINVNDTFNKASKLFDDCRAFEGKIDALSKKINNANEEEIKAATVYLRMIQSTVKTCAIMIKHTGESNAELSELVEDVVELVRELVKLDDNYA